MLFRLNLLFCAVYNFDINKKQQQTANEEYYYECKKEQ